MDEDAIMGYRDDFFVVDNIIGYTGKLNQSPTVYFSFELVEGIEFGRITQDHEVKSNIGRGKVRVRRDYKIYNVKVEKKILGLFTKTVTQGFEYYDGDVQHKSRNAFISRDEFKKGNLELCAQAISKFTMLKPRY